jgi:hypothetical protein
MAMIASRMAISYHMKYFFSERQLIRYQLLRVFHHHLQS